MKILERIKELEKEIKIIENESWIGFKREKIEYRKREIKILKFALAEVE